jgi:hypothetical protein
MTDYSGARDEVFGIVTTLWASPALASVFGYVPELRYDGAEEAGTPDKSKTWARVSAQIVKDGQASLSGGDGTKKYRGIGLAYVQVFGSRIETNSKVNAIALAGLIQAQFRKPSPSGDLWFRDQKIVELPVTDSSYPVNVVVTFEYESIQ